MPEQELLRVKSIEVKGLFGRLHHKVNLNLDERVTILHGPNGVGKSALLRMVNALLHGELGHFQYVPFEQFAIERTDDLRLGMKRKPDDHGTWRVADNPGEPRGFMQDISRTDYDARRKLSSCHLIETQRLLHIQRYVGQDSSMHQTVSPQVNNCAVDLMSKILTRMGEFGRYSQLLDQSYPQRILEKKGQRRELSIEGIKQRLLGLDSRQRELMDLGLLDKTKSHPFDASAFDSLDSTEQRAMSLYIEDMETKLDVLSDLSRRIKLFLEHMNKFRHKRIRIDRQKGFFAEDDKGQPIPLDALSSGEQHELVLHYELLFKVPPNTLVMLDEPELSLHVTWQQRFVPDLIEIVKAAGFDVLLATHSPYIVGDHANLMVPLSDEGE